MEETIDNSKDINSKNFDISTNESMTKSDANSKSKITSEESNKKSVIKTEENTKNDSDSNINKSNESPPLNKPDIKDKKEPPVEKKPFYEFINTHLIPTIIKEFNQRGFEVVDINLKNTSRPIAGDKCWVIYCEIKDTCNFWLSFEKDDISSTKSISLSKPNQEPSIIESFLIDERKITLKLIISRILQRLNGQKLIGIN